MSAQLVKELRDRTGAGFIDCKKALVATNNDLEKAIIWLQEKGAAKAAKKAGAIAAEGVVNIVKNGDCAVLYEVNSQTDFVAQNQAFKVLVDKIGQALLANNFQDIDQARQIKVGNASIQELTIQATAKIGEKITLRRAIKVTKGSHQALGAYVHSNKQIAAIVVTDGGTDEVARNVAMHVASMNPEFLNETKVPQDKISAIKNKIMNSSSLDGKPENIKQQIAQGMLRKKLSELTLVDQEFVMEKILVRKYLSNHQATAQAMYRYEVGEGIEKKVENFAAEVAAQMK